MGQALVYRELAKVFVDRDKHAVFIICNRKNCIVAGVLGSVPDPVDVVAGAAELLGCLALNATVEKQLHSPTPAVISSGSIRSLPIWRCA